MIRAALVLALLATPAFAHEPPGGPDFALYDPDPNHLWNRLHRTLFMRGPENGQYYGHDDFELLYWNHTQHILTGAKHDDAIAVLDEFLASNPGKAFHDPLAASLLQRDLWALCDWAAGRRVQFQWDDEGVHARRLALLNRLARAIQAIALDRDNLESLPDNYALAVASKAYPDTDTQKEYRPFLPPDLLRPSYGWVRIIGSGQDGPEFHLEHTDGRSLFWTYIRLPNGYGATNEYVNRLRDFTQPFEFGPDPRLESPFRDGVPNQRVRHAEDLPQFPEGTMVALVQQMLLIDVNGDIAPTRITESVQIRVYDEVNPEDKGENVFGFRGRWGSYQRPFEFRLSRSALLAGDRGGLIPLDIDDDRHLTFRSHGFDGFEWWSDQPPPAKRTHVPLRSCSNCHQGIGVRSILSLSKIIGTPGGGGPRQGLFHTRLPTRDDETRSAINWKMQRYSWGLLEGLLHSAR